MMRINPSLIPGSRRQPFIYPAFHQKVVSSDFPTTNWPQVAVPRRGGASPYYSAAITGPYYAYTTTGPVEAYRHSLLHFLAPYSGSDVIHFGMTITAVGDCDVSGSGDTKPFDMATKITALSVDWDPTVTWNSRPTPAVDDYSKTFRSRVSGVAAAAFVDVVTVTQFRFQLDASKFPTKPIYGFMIECYPVDLTLTNRNLHPVVTSIAIQNPRPQKTLNVIHRECDGTNRILTVDAPHELIVGEIYWPVISGVDDPSNEFYTIPANVEIIDNENGDFYQPLTPIDATRLQFYNFGPAGAPTESVDCGGTVTLY